MRDPVVREGVFDVTADDMKLTVEEFYRRSNHPNGAAENVSSGVDPS